MNTIKNTYLILNYKLMRFILITTTSGIFSRGALASLRITNPNRKKVENETFRSMSGELELVSYIKSIDFSDILFNSGFSIILGIIVLFYLIKLKRFLYPKRER